MNVSEGQEVGTQEGHDAFCVNAAPCSFAQGPKLRYIWRVSLCFKSKLNA